MNKLELIKKLKEDCQIQKKEAAAICNAIMVIRGK